MTDASTIYAAASQCVESRCVHTTEDACVASWSALLSEAPVVEVTPEAIARARAQALVDFLARYHLPSTWVVGETEDGETITINDALRLAANAEQVAES